MSCRRALVIGLCASPLAPHAHGLQTTKDGKFSVEFVECLAGCGTAAPRADPAQEGRVVSEANAYCRKVSDLPSASRHSERQIRSIQAHLAGFARELGKTAAYLPAGKDLNEAHAARRALTAEASKRSRAGLSPSPEFNRRASRLQLRIYDDELALGLTCAGQIAARAHETAHVIARFPN